MLNKIFLSLLAVSTLLMAFFTFYAWSWLGSIGAPAAAVEGYNYHDNLSWTLLITSTVVLLILGNVILWLTRQAWPLWSTFLYFSIFILIRYFWIVPEFRDYQNQNGSGTEGFSNMGPLFGSIAIIAAAIFTFCDQFAILQLHRTMYPAAAAEPEMLDLAKANDLEN